MRKVFLKTIFSIQIQVVQGIDICIKTLFLNIFWFVRTANRENKSIFKCYTFNQALLKCN